MRFFALLLVVSAAPGCTLVVGQAAANPPSPCAATGDCLAGRVCESGACVDVDPSQRPPPPATLQAIDERGGVVDGPDGVQLSIPAGVLGGAVAVAITRASETLVVDRAVTRGYVISPDVPLNAAATLLVPVDVAACADGCATVHQEGTAWVEQPAGISPALNIEAAAIRAFGTFIVVATGDVDIDVDAGSDAGSDDGDAGSDAGAADAGAPIPSFAACDFTPASCDPRERCEPNTADGGSGGLCLAPCDDVDDTDVCGCCEAIGDAGNLLCLPAELCGAPP